MSSRNTSLLLIAAATLFWLSWFLMPGVGVTDPARIFELVGSNRSSVMLSVITQLLSSVLYVPALLGVSEVAPKGTSVGVRWGSGLLLLGAMGSACDALLHLLAYAMTAPGLETATSLKVMAFMQGPGLLIIAPLIFSFFAGTVALSLSLNRNSYISSASLYLFVSAIGLGILGNFLVRAGTVSGRAVGLSVLGAVSISQVCLASGLLQRQLRRIVCASS